MTGYRNFFYEIIEFWKLVVLLQSTFFELELCVKELKTNYTWIHLVLKLFQRINQPL
jgi:hypothetical protein